MSEEKIKTNVLKGGEFLIKETDPQSVFIPEELSEEQRMMAQAAADFVENEITPNLDRIDKQEPGLTIKLLEQAGELGLLGVSIPEEYGGLGEILIQTQQCLWQWEMLIPLGFHLQRTLE